MTVSLGTFLREEDDYITGELQLSDDGENWMVQLYAVDIGDEEHTAYASVIIDEIEDGTILNQLSWELSGISNITSAIVEQQYCNEIVLPEEWRSGLDERLCIGESWYFWWCYGRALYTLDITDGSVEIHQLLSEEALATKTVTADKNGLYLVLKDRSIVCSNDPFAESIDVLPVMGEFSFILTQAIIDQSNTLFCGIPADELGIVVCIRPVQDTHFEEIDTASPSELRYVYRLPNGKVIETFYKDYVAVCSPSQLSEWQIHHFSNDSNSTIESFCRKGDTLLFDGLTPIVLDTEEARDWRIPALLPQEYQDAYLTRRAHAPISDDCSGLIVWDDWRNDQIFVWDDMRSAHSISYEGQGRSIWGVIAVGNNGWIVMGEKITVRNILSPAMLPKRIGIVL